MPIRLPDEVVQIRDTVRGFIDDVVEPHAQHIDRMNEIPEIVFEKARELGLFGFSIPEEFGGLGTSELVSSVAVETMSYGPGGVTFFVAPSAPAAAINLVGRQDQRQKYLPGLAAGERFAAFCLSEAGAGSDAAGIKTKAVRENGKWRISGTKLWISRAVKADVFFVSAVTDPSKGAKGGITIFILDKRKGINVGKPEWQLGGRGSGSAEVNFDEVEAADDEVLGEIGFGFDSLKFILGRARLWAAARAVGIIGRSLELSLAHAENRVQFGKKIGEFQAIKHKIADMSADLYTARLLLYQAAELFDEGRDAAQEAAYAKLFCSEAAGRAADAAIQIHGAMGVSQEFGVERLFRDARSYRILDGTSDIQRGMIASRVQKTGLGIGLAPGGLS
ncbi:Acyl-CoA dehydrogenase [Ensifer psoraleae]|uniref:acyl-CoA dehydrogenase family protein n=1 Tax=Sinorhizobium psoraleae TaxID=520838 RepID=UPI0015692324|nr:acyl-CoA dehydrogenase family protein [Sinorhizobium psoraleae]NRP72176.1 Acyl-CoA dehydrogenase [Sinorhizobium psoraleae]